MADAQMNKVYADLRNAGRWVKVIGFSSMSRIRIETVKAADDAQSARAVGRQTEVDGFNFKRNFALVDPAELARELPTEASS